MPRSRPAPLRLIPSIHRATHQIGLHLSRLAELGVTQAEAHILDQLASGGDSTVGELHRAFAHRRSTLTSVLDRLAERAFITREPSPQDRRTFIIKLTAAGRAIATRVHNELQRIEGRVLASVPGRDLQGFQRVLAALELALGSDNEAE